MTTGFITLLSFDLWRNCYIKNVVFFEENLILPLPGRFEASGIKSVWGEVSQESPEKSGQIGLLTIVCKSATNAWNLGSS